MCGLVSAGAGDLEIVSTERAEPHIVWRATLAAIKERHAQKVVGCSEIVPAFTAYDGSTGRFERVVVRAPGVRKVVVHLIIGEPIGCQGHRDTRCGISGLMS